MRSDPRSWSIVRALVPVARRWRRGSSVVPRRRRAAAMRLGGEPLEGRAMLATYTWDGGSGGSGTDLLDPMNWVGDVLPQAGDTAVIGSTGSNPTIRIQSASVSGWHIQTSRPIVAAGATLSDVTVTDTGGGSLQVRADSTFTRVATSADVDLTAVDTTPRGRFVRVELPGDGRFLHIAEVQVFRGGTNIALGRPATQSTTDYGGAASRAVDGNTSGIWWDNSVTHTAYQSNPWWEVDLGATTDIDRIVVWNRTDGGLANRLDGFRVVLLDEARGQVWSNAQGEAPQTSVPLTPVGSTLTVIGGLELRNGATIRLGDATGNVAGTLVAAGPQTWSGTGAEPYGGTILLGASASNTIRGAGSVFDPGGLSNESWTIDGISIEGTAGTITEDAQFPVRIVNQGRISADGSGGGAPGMIMLLPRLFTNHGSIVVGAGQRLRLAGSGAASFDCTDPSSSITVDHGTLTVDGRWTAATMGRITRTGGSIRMVGVMEGGGTLDLDAAGGDWELAGGGIAHLALRSPSGASRLVLTSLGGWIGNLDLGADIDGTSGYCYVHTGLTLDGATIRLGNRDGSTAGSMSFFCGSDFTFGGTGEVIFGSNPGNMLWPYSWPPVSAGTPPTRTFTIGSGITIHGAAGSVRSDATYPVRLVNAGRILADAAPSFATDLGYDTNPAGATAITSNPIDTSAIANNPLPQDAYRSIRYDGSMSYVLDRLTPGASYRIRLSFMDDYAPAGEREMTVSINDTSVLSGFDVTKSAGGTFRAVERIVDAVADDTGAVRMQFYATKGGVCTVAAIEAFPAGTTNYLPSARVASIDTGFVRTATITVAPSALRNDGTLGASAGATLSVSTPQESPWTNSAGATISAARGTVNLDGTGWINDGAIVAGAASTMSLGGVDWRNRGTIDSTTGSTITLAGSGWSNQGTIVARDASIDLVGSFTTASLGTIRHVATGFEFPDLSIPGWQEPKGGIRLKGTLDNTGATLDLGWTGGTNQDWGLSGGTIIGGRIASAAGVPLSIVNGGGGGTLQGVTLATDVAVTSETLTIRGGLTLDGATIRVGTQMGEQWLYVSSGIAFKGGTQTVSGNGQIILGASVQTISLAGSGAAGETLTLGPGVTIRGNSGSITGDNALPLKLVNRGRIAADGSLVFPTGFETDTASGGTASGGYPIWDLSAVPSPLPRYVYTTARYGGAGAFTPFSYTLDSLVPGQTYRVRLHFGETNQNAVVGTRKFHVDANGVRQLADFDIVAAAGKPGKVIVRDLDVAADSSGVIRLDFVAIKGNAMVNAVELFSGATRLRAIDSGSPIPSTITIRPTEFLNEGTLAVSYGEKLVVTPTSATNSAWDNRGTLDVGPGTLSGTLGTSIGTVVIRAGGTLAPSGDYVQTAGATTLLGGTLDPVGAATLSGGVLEGTGTVAANLINFGTIRPGGSGAKGTLTVVGDVTLGSGGRLEVDLDGTSNDVMNVQGNLTRGGTLALNVLGGYLPATSGLRFDLLGHASAAGSFATLSGLTLTNTRSFTVDQTSSRTSLVSSVVLPTPIVSLLRDSGADTTDRITTDGGLSVTGVEVGSTVEYSIDAGATWSTTFSPVLGSNAVRVRQRDPAGNISAATSFSFTLLANFAWDGGADGNGTSLFDRVNWAYDALPGTGDKAVVGASGGNPGIVAVGGTIAAWDLLTSRSISVDGTRVDHARITGIDGARLVVRSDTLFQDVTANFVGVTSAIDIDVARGCTLQIQDGLSLSGATIRLGNAADDIGSRLRFYGSQALTGSGTIVFGGGGGSWENQIVTVGTSYGPDQITSQTLSIGDGITIRGQGGAIRNWLWDYPMQIVSNATIRADDSAGGAGSLVVDASLLVNRGTLVAAAGSTLSLFGRWTNTDGRLVVDQGILNLGNSFKAADVGRVERSGGRIRLVGQVIDGGDVNLDNAGGDWELAGGAVANIAVRSPSRSSRLVLTNDGGWIGNLTLAADIDGRDGYAYLHTGLTLEDAAIRLGSRDGATTGRMLFFCGNDFTIGGTGEIVFGGNTWNYLWPYSWPPVDPGTPAARTFRFGAGVTVHGNGGHVFVDAHYPVTIANDGTFRAEDGGTLTLTVMRFDNFGTVSATGDGTLSVDQAWYNPAPAELVNHGLVLADGGTIRVAGAFAQTASATLRVGFSTAQSPVANRVFVSGSASLDGSLVVVRAAESAPVAGRYVVVAGDSVSGTFNSLQVLGASLGESVTLVGDHFTAALAFDPGVVAPVVALLNDTGSSGSDRVTSDGRLSITGIGDGVTEYSTDGGQTWTRSFTPVEGSNTVSVRRVSQAGDFGFVYDDRYAVAGYGSVRGIDSGLGDGSLWANSGWFQLTRTWDSWGQLPTGRYELVTSVGPDTTDYVVGPPAHGISWLTWVGDNLFYPDGDAPAGVHGAGMWGGGSFLSGAGLIFARPGHDSAIRLLGHGNDVYQSSSGWYLSDPSGAWWWGGWAWTYGGRSLTITSLPRSVSATATFSFTLDTAAPAAPTISLVSDTGASATDRITKIGTLSLAGVESKAKVEYSIDGGKSWKTTFTAVEGANAVRVRQTDPAGNSSAAALLEFTLDTRALAPALSLAKDNGSSATDKLTNDGTLALGGVESGAVLEYSIDGGTTWTGSFAAVEGSNAVRVRQIDLAGNVSPASASLAFTLDSIAPSAPLVTLATNTCIDPSALIPSTTVGKLSVSGLETGAKVEYSRNDGAWLSTFTAVAGTNTVRVRQTDVAGNASAIATYTFILDNTAPTILAVGLPVAGSYRTGTTLTFSVTFSEKVFVGFQNVPPSLRPTVVPFIELTIGSTKVRAIYTSGSGSTTLTFAYTVKASDRTTTGMGIASLVSLAAGSSIRDAAGNAANLNFASRLPNPRPTILVNP